MTCQRLRYGVGTGIGVGIGVGQVSTCPVAVGGNTGGGRDVGWSGGLALELDVSVDGMCVKGKGVVVKREVGVG